MKKLVCKFMGHIKPPPIPIPGMKIIIWFCERCGERVKENEN